MSLTVGRRQFLEQLGRSGAALAAGSWLASIGYAAAAGPARAIVNQARVRSELDRRLFGAFLEHLGRAVYTGVYDPGSPLADANGLPHGRGRTRSRTCGVPIMRYPGRQLRLRLQLAGRRRPEGRSGRPCSSARGTRSRPTSSAPTSSSSGARLVGTEPLLGIQLRHRHARRWPSPTSSTATSTKGTKWSELRRSHGYEQPHNVRTGAWATRWTVRGRWARCRRATTAARRATPRGRCA